MHSDNYELRPGDLIRVQVFQEPDLDRDLRVSQDGTIMLPLIGSVSVRGLTVSQVGAEVARRYNADFLVDPQINITVLQYAERRVNVIGAVNTPGAVVFPPEEQMTLLDAVARAGGFNRLADRRRVRLTRIGPDGEPQNFIINADELIDGSAAHGWKVAPDDTIWVPERRI